MNESLRSDFRHLRCAGDFWSLRAVDERAENFRRAQECPATAGYVASTAARCSPSTRTAAAATPRPATFRAPGCRPRSIAPSAWARASAARSLIDFRSLPNPRRAANTPRPTPTRGLVAPRVVRPPRRRNRATRVSIRASSTGKPASRRAPREHAYLTSAGGDVIQRYRFVMPNLSVTRARRRRHADAHAQRLPRPRAAGRRGDPRRGSASAAAAGASPTRRCSCSSAPNCPHGTMDVLLMPDQMMLQIHESIGHPLELDRILGDERNFAGTSFVTLDMFGTYQYGSELLNVTLRSDTPGAARELRLRRRRHAAPRRQYLIRERHARAAAGRRDLAGARRHRRRRQLRAPAAGTGRRSTAWPTSTSSRAIRRSSS